MVTLLWLGGRRRNGHSGSSRRRDTIIRCPYGALGGGGLARNLPFANFVTARRGVSGGAGSGGRR